MRNLTGKEPWHKVAGIQKQLRPGPLQGLPHLLQRFWVCRIPAVTESILRFHLTIGLTDLNDQSIIAEAPPQQAGIHPEQIRKAFPGAAEISPPLPVHSTERAFRL